MTIEIDDPCSWTDDELFSYLQTIGEIEEDDIIDNYLRLELLKLVQADLGI